MAHKTITLEQAENKLLKHDYIILPTPNSYYFATLPHRKNIQNLFKIKGKPTDSKPVYLFSSIEQILKFTAPLSKPAIALLKAFTPGQITLILPSNGQLEAETFAAQIPNQAEVLELLVKLNSPLAITSANPHSLPGATNMQMLGKYFTDFSEHILDLEHSENWASSTVIDCTDSEVVAILKPGSISYTEVSQVLPNIKVKKSYAHNISKSKLSEKISRTHKLNFDLNSPTVVLGTKEKIRELFNLHPLDYFTQLQHGKLKLVNLGSQTNLASVVKNLNHRLFEASVEAGHKVILLDQNWGNHHLSEVIKYIIETYTTPHEAVQNTEYQATSWTNDLVTA